MSALTFWWQRMGAGAVTSDYAASRFSSTVMMDSAIDATGVTDVTSAVNAYFVFIAAAYPAGVTVRLPKGATYRCEGSVYLGSNVSHVEILGPRRGTAPRFYCSTDGTAATPWTGSGASWPLNRANVVFADCTDVHLKQFTIRGNNPPVTDNSYYLTDPAYNAAYEGQAAVRLTGASGCTITLMDLGQVWGDFIYYGYGTSRDCLTCTATFNTMLGAGRQGVAVTALQDGSISDNTMSYIRRSVFDVEPNFSTSTCARVAFARNAITQKRLSFMAAKGYAATISDITVETNVLGTGATLNVEVDPVNRATNWIIRNNTSTAQYGSAFPLMIVRDVDGVTITNNTQLFQAGRSPLTPAFVTMERCCTMSVSGNTTLNVTTQSTTDGYDCTPAVVPPVAAFRTTVNQLVVTLTNTSTDADGPAPAAVVDWGDGGATSPVSGGGVVTHTYASAAARTVTLTATDAGSNTNAVAATVETVAAGVTVYRTWHAGDALPASSTFTGPALASYHNAVGVVATSTLNTIRDSHYIRDPANVLQRTALIESARTNLIGFSDQIESWTLSSATVTVDAHAAPDGTTTADLVVPAAATAFHGATRNYAVADGTTVTGQVYARDRLDTPYLLLGLLDKANVSQDSVVKLSNGTVISSPAGYTIRTELLADGWLRGMITGPGGTGATTPRIRAQMAQTPTVAGFLGVPSEQGQYLWRGNVQASGTPKSGVQTVGNVTGTLGADALTFSLVNTSGAAATLYTHYFDFATWAWVESAVAYTDSTTFTPTLDRAYFTVAWINGTRTAAQCRAILGEAF